MFTLCCQSNIISFQHFFSLIDSDIKMTFGKFLCYDEFQFKFEFHFIGPIFFNFIGSTFLHFIGPTFLRVMALRNQTYL